MKAARLLVEPSLPIGESRPSIGGTGFTYWWRPPVYWWNRVYLLVKAARLLVKPGLPIGERIEYPHILESFMSNLKPGSLAWLDNLASLEAQYRGKASLTQNELAKALNLSPTHIGYLQAIGTSFDQAALEKVRQAGQGNPPFILSLNSALELARLKGKVPNLPSAVHAVLDEVISRRLAKKSIKGLVIWVASGKPATEFDPSAPKPTIEGITEKSIDAKRQSPVDRPQIPINPGLSSMKAPKRKRSQAVSPQPAIGGGTQTVGQRIGGGIGTAIALVIDAILGRLKGLPSAQVSATQGEITRRETLIGKDISIKEQDLSPEAIPEKGMKVSASKSPVEGQGLSLPISKKGIGVVFQRLLKIGKWIVKQFWQLFLKNLHHFFKWVAKLIVPTSHSSRSGHKHSGGHSSGRGSGDPLPTMLHWLVYSLCQLTFWWVVLTWLASLVSPRLKPWAAFPFRYLAHLLTIELPAWLWPQVTHHWVIALIAGVLLLISLISAFTAQPMRMAILFALLGWIWFYGKGWGTRSLPPLFTAAVVNTPVAQTPVPVEKGIEPSKVQNTNVPSGSLLDKHPAPPKRLSRQVGAQKKGAPTSGANSVSAKAWQAEDEDENYLEQEIEVLPPNSRVKSFAVTLDAGMTADMASRRLEDLQMPEKYSLMIGREKQKVLSFITSYTNFILTYQGNSPLGGLLGESSKIQFYWEDVQAIHCDEIEIETGTTHPRLLYQCSLVVSGLKKPLTVQCASTKDLIHLVSALEVWST